MAPGALELGPRLRHRGRPSVPRFRLPEPRALRGRRLHRARERTLAGRDGAARHAPRRGWGLRPSQTAGGAPAPAARALPPEARGLAARLDRPGAAVAGPLRLAPSGRLRSEEHTSELQSPCNLVCRLLLEKKKKKQKNNNNTVRMH